MAEVPERPEIKELQRFIMWANNPSNDVNARSCRLAWGIRDANPRLTVYTNDPADTVRYGIIYAGMNPETVMILLDKMINVYKGPIDTKDKIENKTRIRDQTTGKYGPIVTHSHTLFGKDADGICWLSVIEKDRPKIKFEFTLSNFHVFTNDKGEEMTKEESSQLQALTTCHLLKKIYPNIVSDYRQRTTPMKTVPANGTPKVTELSFDDDTEF